MLYIFFVVNTYLISFKMIICICSNAISEANFREFKVLLNLNILGGVGGGGGDSRSAHDEDVTTIGKFDHFIQP